MNVILKATKNLIAEEDLFLGRQGAIQYRGGAAYVASPIRILKIVDSIQSLQAVDPTKFDFALVRPEWKVPNENNDPVEEPVNEFYSFDYNSNENEDLPSIVKPSKVMPGRWKQVLVGRSSIKTLILDELEKALKNVNAYIEKKVKEIVAIELPLAVEEVFGEIRRKGGEFDPTLQYNTNDYVRAFVLSRGVITERLYMVTRDTVFEPINYGPLDGDIYMRNNGTIVYKDNDKLVENPGYTRVFTIQNFAKTFEVEENKNYSVFEPRQDTNYAKGRMKVKFWKDDTVTASFDVVFGGSSHKDFTLENVQYSRLARSVMVGTLGHLYYPGFAIYADDIYFGFSIEKTNLVDRIWIDFTDLSKEPIPDDKPFASDRAYAARAGGGSYIPDLGDLKRNLRKPVDSDAGCFDFYLFMRGALVYTGPLTLVRDIYHQYYDSQIVLPTMDISGTHFRTTKDGKPVGTVDQAGLPNVKWKGTLQSTETFEFNVGYQEEEMWVAGVNKDGFVRLTHDKRFVESPYDYDAGRDCSSIYQDGVTDVQTLALFSTTLLICY